MKRVIVLFLLILLIIFSLFIWQRTSQKTPYELYADLIPGTYRVGFTNLEKEIQIDNLPIKGAVPTWISGTLLRNGPAKFSEGSSFVTNWLDGLAMIHAFSFENGKISYANKFLKTSAYNHVQEEGNMSYPGFAQDPCKSIFKRFFSLFIPKKKEDLPKKPNANVNIAKYADHYIALTETPLPIEFDPKTLETIGVMHYNDKFPESKIHESAHPHYDSNAKEHYSYLTKFGRKSTHNLYRIKDGSMERELIAEYEVKEPSYMHSFVITKNYAILTLIPLVVNPLDLLISNKPFIKNFKFKSELGTKFLLIDRFKNKIIDEFQTIPFFTFHHVNAFEQNNSIFIDIIVYKDQEEIGDLNIDKVLAPQHTHKSIDKLKYTTELQNGKLYRFEINLKTKTVTYKKLSDEIIELPRINYEQYNGKDYTFVYAGGSSDTEEDFAFFDKLVKINVKTGQPQTWYQKDTFPGEPVFVPKPNTKTEDDGAVLSVVLDAKKETSFLLILDGQNFKEIARAEVPHHIPFGIHGEFFK